MHYKAGGVYYWSGCSCHIASKGTRKPSKKPKPAVCPSDRFILSHTTLDLGFVGLFVWLAWKRMEALRASHKTYQMWDPRNLEDPQSTPYRYLWMHEILRSDRTFTPIKTGINRLNCLEQLKKRVN